MGSELKKGITDGENRQDNAKENCQNRHMARGGGFYCLLRLTF